MEKHLKWTTYFQKVGKVLVKIFSTCFSLRSNGKKLLETVISTKCVIILSFALKFFGISDGLSLTFNTDF